MTKPLQKIKASSLSSKLGLKQGGKAFFSLSLKLHYTPSYHHGNDQLLMPPPDHYHQADQRPSKGDDTVNQPPLISLYGGASRRLFEVARFNRYAKCKNATADIRRGRGAGFHFFGAALYQLRLLRQLFAVLRSAKMYAGRGTSPLPLARGGRTYT